MPTLDKLGRQVIRNTAALYVTGAELAEVFGVERSTLYHYEKNLGMPKIKRDLYDLKKCCAWYIAKLRSEANAASNEKLNAERIALTKAKARKAIIENDLLAGSTISLEQVKSELVLVVGQLKDNLNNLAGSLANDVANINEPSVAYDRIETAVAEALNQVCAQLFDLSKPNGVTATNADFDD